MKIFTFFLLLILPLLTQAREVAVGDHGMVATDQHLASQAGLKILKAGGNAIDAAVAVGYALAVTEPCCGNIGGGGFMLVRMHDGREQFINFRETAPLLAKPNMYLDTAGNVIPNRSRKGWQAVGVPGTVMGLEVARKKWGTMSRSALIAPAIQLAQGGFVLTAGDLEPFKEVLKEEKEFNFFDQPNVRNIFLVNGKLPESGYRLKQPELAKTLTLIAQQGTDVFYRGEIAKKIVAASQAHGGILTLKDFANYHIEEIQPLHCHYRDYQILSAPPPSSGGVTLCEILHIVEPFPLEQWGWHRVASLHYLIEAERRAYADRNTYLGDPAFVNNPIKQLLDLSYAEKLRKQIDPVRATPSAEVKPGLSITKESNNTTHYSIVDQAGNAVAVTYSLNAWFGAGVIAGDTGFFLNDQMDDFTVKVGVPNMFKLVQGEANGIQPGKRPLSSMTPTIVTKDNKLVMVTGSPGGSRITTIVLETLMNVLNYHMNAQQAVDAPRVHMQWLPDEVQYEPNAITTEDKKELMARGYIFEEIPKWGSAQAIVMDAKTNKRYGGSDRRHTAGAALGY